MLPVKLKLQPNKFPLFKSDVSSMLVLLVSHPLAITVDIFLQGFEDDSFFMQGLRNWDGNNI